jgi:hypothetical protein
MERIRKEEVYINWYYHQALAWWGDEENHAFTKPNLEPGTSKLSDGNQIHQIQDDTFRRTTGIPRLKDGTSQRIRIEIPRLQDCTSQKTKHKFLGCTSHRMNMNSSVTRRCFLEDNNINSLTCITFDKTEVTLGWSESNCPHDTTFNDSLISFGEEPRGTTKHCRYLHRIFILRNTSKDVAKINPTYDGNINKYIDLTW